MTPEERAVVERLFPIAPAPYTIRPRGNVGLVIVDPVCGFTRAGNLADPEHMVPMVARIAAEYRQLKEELGERLHVLIFMDEHDADIPEPPYPPHCVEGTGEEEIDPDLAFLLNEPTNVTVIRKDCINGFVGVTNIPSSSASDSECSNRFVDWVLAGEITTLLFCGDCTDICVLDLVVTCLSARNHGMFTVEVDNYDLAAFAAAITGMDLVVLAHACETFHATAIGHDREAWHHVGLATMASRGAILASEVVTS